jgi:hypothetical protein
MIRRLEEIPRNERACDSTAYDHGICCFWHLLRTEVVCDFGIWWILPVRCCWVGSRKSYWNCSAFIHLRIVWNKDDDEKGNEKQKICLRKRNLHIEPCSICYRLIIDVRKNFVASATLSRLGFVRISKWVFEVPSFTHSEVEFLQLSCLAQIYDHFLSTDDGI